MKNVFIVLLSILVFAFTSCSSDDDESQTMTLSVISYNVKCLFDDVDTGNEYQDYRRSNGYTQTKYNQRISSYSSLFKTDDFSSVDIIFLQEVESEKVLEDLLDNGLRRRGFVYYGIAETSGPISVAFISKIKPHAVNIHKAGSQRAMLSVDVIKDSRHFLLLSLHAKSNLGTEEENLKLRKEYAALINSIVSQAGIDDVIICGDFNSEAKDGYDDILSLGDAAKTNGSVPVISDSKAHSASFYDPVSDPSLPLKCDGTYWHENVWHDYDHILLSPSVTRLSENVSFEILAPNSLSQSGIPFGYNVSEGKGYSDHYPVKAVVTYWR